MKGFGKIGIVFMVLVVALGMLGVGYAKWSEDLHITGTVNTGDIGVAWHILSVGDTEPPDKNVSCVDPVITGDTLYVTISNAYPCIDYYVTFNLEGTGSVPVHFSAPAIDRTNMPSSAIIEITGIDWSTLQLHAGGGWAEGTLHVHLANAGTLESSTYTFSVALEYHQWNE